MKYSDFFHTLAILMLAVFLISGCSPSEPQFSTPTMPASPTLLPTNTPVPTLTPSPSPTPTATPIIKPGFRVIVDEATAKGIIIGKPNLAELLQVIPVEWLTEQQVPPRYEIHITPLATFIADCKYVPTGTVPRIRVDIDVLITDLQNDAKIIGKNHFRGYPPEHDECPGTLRFGAKNVLLGLPTAREFRRWVIETTLTDGELPAPAAGVSDLAFSPDGKAIVFGSEDGTVKFFDLASKEVSHVLEAHQDEVLKIALSGDGKLLASASRDGTAKLWDLTTKTELDTYPSDASSPKLFFYPDGKKIAVKEEDWGILTLWDTSRRGKSFGRTNFVGMPAFSPDGVTYATSYYLSDTNDALKIQEWLTDKELQFVEMDIAIYVIAYSPDGKLIAIGNGVNQSEPINKIRLLSADTLEQIFKLDNLEHFESIIWSSDNAILATRNKEFIRLWDATTGMELHTFNDPWFTSWAFSPDGKTLVASSWTGTVSLWDVTTGDKLIEFKNTYYVQ